MSQQIFNQAVSLHQQGRLEEAARLYQQVLAEGGPADFEARYLLAFLRYQQGRLGEALEAVTTALAGEPNSAKALLLHGILLQASGKPIEALAQFGAAGARDPGNAEIWYNRGVILAGLERPQEAIESFDKALAIQPTPDSWNNRGAVLLGLKRWAEALQSFDAALILKPDYAQVWANRGSVLRDMNRFEDALSACDKALSLMPDFVEAWNERGGALLMLKRFDEALASYDKATGLRPQQALGWNNRGTALQALKRYEDAIASHDRALALVPLYVPARVQRAVALQSLYRLDEALEGAEEALRIQPEHPDALFTCARILCELDRAAEAHSVLRRRAELVYAAQPFTKADDPPQKQRHDAEQREYLAHQGIEVGDGIHFAGGERLAGPAINPLNGAAADQTWKQKQPPILVVDDLLTPEAMEGLRRFCRGSTIWRRSYEGGYLGAMAETGFACPLLVQIADELRAVFPGIFAEHKLRIAWGFKYDSSLTGTAIHADQAAVNVNFWITPDEANRNPESGGLVIWDACAPPDWNFGRYNGDAEASRAFLAGAGAKSVTVPYRANRAVIFDSDLFHETDAIDFEEGYLNRRINITMLFGRRVADGS